MMKYIPRTLYLSFLAILIIIYSCENESVIRDEDNDTDTGIRFISTPTVTIHPDENYKYVVVAVDYHSNDLIY